MRLRELVGQLAVSRKLGILASFLAATVVCLLLLVHGALDSMSGVRAFVGGEALWSKAQKDAVLALSRAAAGEHQALPRFFDAIAIPLGDRIARRELDRPRPDLARVMRGFVAGRIHPEDVPSMVLVFRRLRRTPYVARAIEMWEAADRDVSRLVALARHVERDLAAGRPSPATTERLQRKLTTINAHVTPYEDAFSAALVDGARMLRGALMLVLVGASTCLVALGIALARLFIGNVRRSEVRRRLAEYALAEEARVSRAIAQVAQHLIAQVDAPILYERLSQVTADVMGALASTTLLWDADARRYDAVAAFGPPTSGAETLRTIGPPETAFPHGPIRCVGSDLLAIALHHEQRVVGVQVIRPYGVLRDEHPRIASGVAAVATLALANSHLVARLEEASRMKSQFVSTMSHELRTPLNVMLGYADMARDSQDDDERAMLLARIETAGRDLLELIESTLEIGRMESGRDVVRLETVSLRTLLETIGGGCDRLPRRESVTLEWPASVPDLAITTDPRKVTVILRNLVGNALKFTDTGTVRLHVAVDHEGVALRVTDTGIGIRPEDQERVFEMFRQADGSDSRRFGGIGLGLHIVRRFVEQLGGRVVVTSELGRGAEFTVTLPLRSTSPAAQAA
jgi:signal transduction histidine kinase